MLLHSTVVTAIHGNRNELKALPTNDEAPSAVDEELRGGDDTFASFPGHLSALVSHALPNVDILTEVYPKFKTQGELSECVGRFREWLENKVIDLEVARSTPSPTIDPSVHVILLGHSMGGIVAAETYLLLASEQPLRPAQTATKAPQPGSASDQPDTSNFMFPYIQAILAFDTPFLGLAPGMVAHGLEGGHKMASNAYSAYTEIAGIFGWGSKSESNVRTEAVPGGMKALPAPVVSSTADAAAAPKWQHWGKYAIVEMLEKAMQEREAASANLFTQLGRGAREGYGVTSAIKGPERTFANLPLKARAGSDNPVDGRVGTGMLWWAAVNEKAGDETSAHISMFTPKDNPGFYTLVNKSKELIVSWVGQGSWYNTSDKKSTTVPDEHAKGLDGTKHSSDDDDFDEHHDDCNKVLMRDEDKDGVVVDKA
ncbi:hypothetical protein DV738_g4270, partial [Chaetothyriales sp. CBS 135597]